MSDFLWQLSEGGVYEAQRRVAIEARSCTRRVLKMEAALFRAEGYKFREIGKWQGVSRQMADTRSKQGAPYVLALLRSVM